MFNIVHLAYLIELASAPYVGLMCAQILCDFRTCTPFCCVLLLSKQWTFEILHEVSRLNTILPLITRLCILVCTRVLSMHIHDASTVIYIGSVVVLSMHIHVGWEEGSKLQISQKVQ